MQGWKRTALIVTSCALVAAMVIVWVVVDLGTADGTASVIGASAGVVGLVYALINSSSPAQGPTLTVTRTGKATTRGGGTANTGITMPAAGGQVSATAEDTGDTESDGPGEANTGIRLT
ncbi:hypothetical protein [Streptomyces sp. NPDC051000]|uniref:hypothetical protein n=1 Tax=Streptomyces sp. NPDC051000 TaxID=3155520 RepID=UPI00340C20E8